MGLVPYEFFSHSISIINFELIIAQIANSKNLYVKFFYFYLFDINAKYPKLGVIILDTMNVLLCICSSIAIYKSCEIARQLTNIGHNVKVVMSANASQMLSPLIFTALTNNETYINDTGKMEHISLARWADILLLCPATANTIGSIANGLGGSLLLDIFLAKTQSLRTIIAPAMNSEMWNNPFMQTNLQKLKEHGFEIIKPQTGKLACGEEGEGKLADINEIVSQILPKKDTKILITAGGTIEEMDSVRYMTNYSSGKQAFEIATKFAQNGYDVTVIKAKTDIKFPQYIKIIEVKSANNMLNSVMENITNCDVFISAAAVADFGFTKYEGKIKKDKITNINIIKNSDILHTVCSSSQKPKCVIGFAAESENIKENAINKLQKKQCDFIVANELVFGSDITRGVILGKKIEENFSCTKKDLAHKIYEITLNFLA